MTTQNSDQNETETWSYFLENLDALTEFILSDIESYSTRLQEIINQEQQEQQHILKQLLKGDKE